MHKIRHKLIIVMQIFNDILTLIMVKNMKQMLIECESNNNKSNHLTH